MWGKSGYALLILVVIAVSVLARVIPLESESLTGDELSSLEAARDLFGSGLKRIGYDLTHPPFYYLLIHPIVTYIGGGVFHLRLLSLVSGIGIVLFIVLWTSRLAGNRYAGILAGLLAAISSTQIYFSQDGESFALYSLLILFAAMALHEAVEKRRRKHWMLYAVLIALSFLTHYVSVLYFLAFGIYIAARGDYGRLKRWMLYSLPAIALLGLWFVYLWASYTVDVGRMTPLSWIDGPEKLALFYLFAGFNGLPHITKGAALTLAALSVILVLCARTVAIRREWKNDPARFGSVALTALAAFVPPVILFAAASPPLSMRVWLERHVVPSQAFLIVFVVTAIWYLFGEKKRLLIVAGIVFLGLQAAGSIGWTQGPQRHPYREIARYTVAINAENVPVYTTYYRCPGRVCNFYLGRGEYVKRAPEDPAGLPSELILIYRPAVPEDFEYYDRLLRAGWREKGSSHFGGAWGHTVVTMERGGD